MSGPRIVVIGGGAAGLMAAGRAAERGARVILVEKNQTLGAKLLLSGKGRCNLTSAEEDLETFLSAYGSKGKFLYSAFSRFGPARTLEFFASRGLRTKVERGKRVFPEKGGSERVINCLIGYIRQGGVTVYRNREALNLEIRDGRAVRFILRGQEVEGDAFIVCTGGKSFPKTGSTGDGYRFAKRAGHEVIQPVPALCPVRLKEKWPQSARGLNLKNVSLTLLKDGIVVSRRFGELLLTHFGISGPIAMDMSRDIGEACTSGNATLILDLKPALTMDVLTARIERDLKKYAGKMFRDCLKDLLPRDLIPAVVEKATIPPDKRGEYISPEEKRELACLLKEFPLTPEGLLGFDWSIVTSGGVDLREIDPGTMRSKIVENLYFAGEILDIDGPTGGYNLQMCWSTGYAAGDSAASSACLES
ncbi:aminoacetone oxidase family FAD-binding enzyme [Aminivibrio sp.]|jgi:hypothetical protein|uniref:NAD(P)/FAD-dependent oxidoreductase n=1 Tax=Aminivibrio sp. TaxID=1872489 RepID=UPI001A621BBD|nr:aminoacetone oxidase family FAD-binding enzyme [Aminivibrio sp.]MBL3539598.1 aminoacetone oxidase family FAD-binding enzyme [Aminivibrio sp.]MDK2958472.1 hypothetical protein [Synergistaceae bacterium]